MKRISRRGLFLEIVGYLKYILAPIILLLIWQSQTSAAAQPIMSTLTSVKDVLGQVGPALSAVLFVIAGIFYALGQMLPPDKKANFHTTAVNIIIGAIVVAVLSAASTGLAGLSTHIIGNMTQLNVTG
jgi:hypothetical protein